MSEEYQRTMFLEFLYKDSTLKGQFINYKKEGNKIFYNYLDEEGNVLIMNQNEAKRDKSIELLQFFEKNVEIVEKTQNGKNSSIETEDTKSTGKKNKGKRTRK